MRIIKIKDSEKLSEWDLKRATKMLHAEWFVYLYKNYGYEGSGFAVWKTNDNYYYTALSHCSCYGPVDDLNSIAYDSIKELEVFCDKYNYGREVIDYIKKKLTTPKEK